VREREIIGKAPKQGHSSMGMGVDQPRHDDAPLGVYHMTCFRERFIGCFFFNAFQTAIGYADQTPVENIKLRVDR
jgi:hypothetical protein